jgi:predicted phosphodiesterase
MIDGSEILMVHGSPKDSTTEMSHDLSDEALAALLDDDPADVVICGATHVPYTRQVGEHRVVNVGSVGAAPEGNVAHFTVVTPRMEGAIIEQTCVEYDAD